MIRVKIKISVEAPLEEVFHYQFKWCDLFSDVKKYEKTKGGTITAVGDEWTTTYLIRKKEIERKNLLIQYTPPNSMLYEISDMYITGTHSAVYEQVGSQTVITFDINVEFRKVLYRFLEPNSSLSLAEQTVQRLKKAYQTINPTAQVEGKVISNRVWKLPANLAAMLLWTAIFVLSALVSAKLRGE